MALHYQYSFNARLILQAALRQLKYAREDLTELNTPDPSTVQAIVNETETLEQVSSFFFPRGYTQQADAFYVGFWTAWTEVRRVALARLSEVRWLRGIESINVALEQVLRQMDFEEAIEAVQTLRLSLGYKSILTRSCRDYDPSSLAALQALDMSLSQNSLYNGFKTQRSSSLSSDDQPVQLKCAPRPVLRDRLAQAGLDQPYRPALRPFDVFSTNAPTPIGIPNPNDKLKSDAVPQGFDESFTAVASAYLNASTSPHRKRTLSETRSNDSGESNSAGRRQRSPPTQMHLKDGVKVVERLKPRGARRFVLD